jgi:thymidylate synthase
LHKGSVRYMDQLESCIQRLKQDPGSRQAVIMILNPGNDLMEKTKDVPCNDLLQFFIRNNKLHMSCYVRSNDLKWGFPYDIFHWTMLQELFASILNVELGEYHHFVGSLHIYNKDIDFMKECLNSKVNSISMTPMPKNKDLSIIEELSAYEKINRSGQQVNCTIPYWSNLLEYLK